MPENSAVLERIQRAFHDAGIEANVAIDNRTITLDGIVDTEEARQAARDIVEAEAGSGWTVEDDLEVESVLPTDVGDFAGGGSRADLRSSVGGGQGEPDFMSQVTLESPLAASGAGSSNAEDDASAGDEVYIPPTDPVVYSDEYGNTRMLNGFGATSMADVPVDRSTMDGKPGDEALSDAVERELREDASTTELHIRVHVHQGVVHLRGTVSDLDDADNAESVAGRVPGVREVLEELDVSSV